MNTRSFFVCFAILVAVLFAAQPAMANVTAPESVPTLGEWGMIGTALALGLAAGYRILKGKK
jgi:hypothetical protein